MKASSSELVVNSMVKLCGETRRLRRWKSTGPDGTCLPSSISYLAAMEAATRTWGVLAKGLVKLTACILASLETNSPEDLTPDSQRILDEECWLPLLLFMVLLIIFFVALSCIFISAMSIFKSKKSFSMDLTLCLSFSRL